MVGDKRINEGSSKRKGGEKKTKDGQRKGRDEGIGAQLESYNCFY